MRFRINQIGDEGLALDVLITAEWLAAACPDLDARPAAGGIRVRGRLTRSGADYLLQGELRGTMETACARCLETAQLAIEVPLAVTFVPGNEDEVGEAED